MVRVHFSPPSRERPYIEIKPESRESSRDPDAQASTLKPVASQDQRRREAIRWPTGWVESAAAIGSGHSPPHLENCTGKKLFLQESEIDLLNVRKIPVRRTEANESGEHKSRNHHSFLNSLRKADDDTLARNQASKSAGWMPWH